MRGEEGRRRRREGFCFFVLFWGKDARTRAQDVEHNSTKTGITQHSLCLFHTSRADTSITSAVGRSLASVVTLPSRFTVSIPAHTRPKMVCLPSREGQGARVMKNLGRKGGVGSWHHHAPRKHITHTRVNQSHPHNTTHWLPLVPGPALAMLSTPAPVWCRPGWSSSPKVGP